MFKRSALFIFITIFFLYPLLNFSRSSENKNKVRPQEKDIAIDIAGWTRLIRGPIKYLSFYNDRTIDKRKIKYRKIFKKGSFSNPYLKQGDLIVVGSSLLCNSAEMIKEITAPFQRLYSSYRLYQLISD